MELEHIVEALIFASPDGVSAREIARVVSSAAAAAVRDRLAEMETEPETAEDGVPDAVAAGLSPLDAEREVLGVDHAEVGALIAEHWNLPEALVVAIRYHHRPFEGTHPACWAVAAANWAAHPEDVTPWEIASLEVPLGLSPERFQALCRDVAQGRDSFVSEFEAACLPC